ncbi:hypothetical protein [Candidatus Methylobacter oryzae]|uniref:Uncharacterized protein n=1 Tax=Candidatus Methylobacter oryzae TaxID=2497749 RepID=A0ABY3CBT1_9GAMM|nr:hypothetical protein [Candidatus Methylobacter oryzae]TRW97006.1 hypothetical protein EKO24_008275 [Candidatus Methylobacter oryzae]
MFTTVRKFTVIFLAILQLIAPLVHAHAGEKVSGIGLHVPGLEIYGVGQYAFMSGATNHDFDFDRIGSRPLAALLSAADQANAEDNRKLSRPPSPAVEGIIVGVDAGMKDRQINAAVDLDDSQYLHQQAALFKTAISPFDINFSPQSTQVVCRLFVPSLSPRAPPAQ